MPRCEEVAWYPQSPIPSSPGTVSRVGDFSAITHGKINLLQSIFQKEFFTVSPLTLRNPIRQGCGLALRRRSRRSQNSSGSTLASINSCISVLTFFSTVFGSRLDNSRRLAKNLRHFSLVLCKFWFVGVAFAVTTTAAVVAFCVASAGTGATEATGGGTCDVCVDRICVCCAEIAVDAVVFTTILAVVVVNVCYFIIQKLPKHRKTRAMEERERDQHKTLRQ